MPPDCEYKIVWCPDGFEKLWWVKGYKAVIVVEFHNLFHKFKYYVSLHRPADLKSDFRPIAIAETIKRMKYGMMNWTAILSYYCNKFLNISVRGQSVPAGFVQKYLVGNFISFSHSLCSYSENVLRFAEPLRNLQMQIQAMSPIIMIWITRFHYNRPCVPLL